jgi:hypothetical protein
VRAHAATLNHTFSQSVALGGANPAFAPSIIDPPLSARTVRWCR